MDNKDILSSDEIKAHLTHGVFDFITLEETGSTNDDGKRLAEDGAPEFTVITAERQTKGKGRLGRSFFSPQSTGIYFSVVLRPKMPPQDCLFITVSAAVATAMAIESVCGKQAGIKWVNDVFVGSKKVCGILTEAAFNAEGTAVDHAVLGIGVNVAPPPGGFPPEISDVAACLYPDGGCPKGVRERLLAAILDNFYRLYSAFPQKDFLTEYRDRSILTGRDVTVHQGDNSYPAHVEGIDDDCRLILTDKEGKIALISAGEVSVRL